MRNRLGLAGLVGVVCLAPATASAIPSFARQYQQSCAVCHAAVPRLNAFGQQFVDDNLFQQQWPSAAVADLGDPELQLPKELPLALRLQGYVQARQAESRDLETGATIANSEFDIQAPYQVKLLAGGPITERLSYYFYAIFAEKGVNGAVVVEDAWLAYGDLFGSGISLQLGQFQVSDLMFPREVRLTFQDFIAYRLAGITYDRGVLLGRDIGPVSLEVGAVNGDGVDESFAINSPGLARPDRLFDRNTQKSVFGRVGVGAGTVSVGLFGLTGRRPAIAGPLGTERAGRHADVLIAGLDVSATVAGKLFLFAQALWNRWDGFIVPGRAEEWFGGFAGADFVLDSRWAFSLLYNYDSAGDLDDTGTVYEGIDTNLLTGAVAYYLARNAKLVLEGTVDFLPTDGDADFVGHETRESSVLFGVDVAF